MQLSIIVPCYNEGANIEDFYNMTTNFLVEEKMKYELIMVDDGSSDNTMVKLKELSCKDRNVKVIGFSRNFGKEAAMLAGLKEASGEYVAIMDADMQHTVEDMFMLYNKLLDNKDYDVVCAYRQDRNDETSIKRTFTSIFYKLNNTVSYVKLLPGASDFRVFRASVKDAIISLPENNRFLKGIFSWIGFNTIYVPYTPKQRLNGTTNWSPFKLIKYSINGIISFSTKPLKFVSISFVLLFGIALLNFLLMGKLSDRTILLYLGILMLNLAIICLYLIKMYTKSLNRPIYIIKTRLGFDKKTTK